VPLVEKELFTLPEHLSSPPVFSGVRATQFLVLYVSFVDRCLSFLFWPLCCLYFFDIRILITLLVSSDDCYIIQWESWKILNDVIRSRYSKIMSKLKKRNMWSAQVQYMHLIDSPNVTVNTKHWPFLFSRLCLRHTKIILW